MYISTYNYRKELLKISAAVMGIEFAYAAETAFVSPTLLKIGQLLYIGYVFYFVLSRCVAVAHDPDLVPVPPGGVLPHPHPGQPLRQVQVTTW